MKRSRKVLNILMIGVMLTMVLSGCFPKKYKLLCDSGFESKKKTYAAGETVTVYYDFIATDTDYVFYSNDVDLKSGYDNEHGYVFTFTMPAHDVMIQMYSKNTMVYDPDAEREETEAELIASTAGSDKVFRYYRATTGTDGGDGYDEYTLYRRARGDMIMVRASEWPDEPKSRRACIVTDSALYDCLKIVDKNDMRKWNKTDGEAITGAVYIAEFWEAGKLLRADSENMPADGLQAFGEIEKVMKKAWRFYGPKN